MARKIARTELATATPHDLAMQLIALTEGMEDIRMPTASTGQPDMPVSSTGQELSAEEVAEMNSDPEANQPGPGGSLEGTEVSRRTIYCR